MFVKLDRLSVFEVQKTESINTYLLIIIEEIAWGSQNIFGSEIRSELEFRVFCLIVQVT